MGVTNDNVITAITLLERLEPILNANSRATINVRHLTEIHGRLTMVLQLINPVAKDVMILTPLANTVKLIEALKNEPGFVETSQDVKNIICEKIQDALNSLYLFAGKYYMENHFTYTPGKVSSLRNIVDHCIKNGFYFGMEVQ